MAELGGKVWNSQDGFIGACDSPLVVFTPTTLVRLKGRGEQNEGRLLLKAEESVRETHPTECKACPMC